MKLVKSLLLGSAVGLIGAAGAQAADLPTRKSAPVEYVRICDAYGAGFFYIPGTDTCLKVGGLVLGEVRAFNPSYSVSAPYASGSAKGSALAASSYGNQRERDAYGYAALGRIELDTRTATAWGTLRTFARVDSYYGAGDTASTGSNQQGFAGTSIINTTANTNVSRYTTILNKAFIQFGGLTAGYAQSIFDFYANAYDWSGIRGANNTAAMFAYTATFGNGFSASIAAEDQAAHRVNLASEIAGTTAVVAGDRIPDVTANLRYDAAWGAVQVSGAAHQNNWTAFPTGATIPGNVVSAAGAAPGPTVAAFPTGSGNQYGFAAQVGVQFNLDSLSPGDKLWLEAAYEKGAISYLESNLVFSNGTVNADRSVGMVTPNYGIGWQHGQDYDCVLVPAGYCEQQNGFVAVASFKHYWLPTLSSSFYGSFMRVNYGAAAINSVGGGIGATSYQEEILGSNLIWTPVKGLDIGGEFDYYRMTTLTGGPSFVVPAGFPTFTSTAQAYAGRIRVQRAF